MYVCQLIIRTKSVISLLSAPFIVSLHVFVKTRLCMFQASTMASTALCLYFCRCRTIHHAHSYTNDDHIRCYRSTMLLQWSCNELYCVVTSSFSSFVVISYFNVEINFEINFYHFQFRFIAAARIVVSYYIVSLHIAITTIDNHRFTLLSHAFLFLVFFLCHRTIILAIVRAL